MKAFIKIDGSEVRILIAEYLQRCARLDVDPKSIDLHTLGEMEEIEIPIDMDKQFSRKATT